MTQPKLLSRAQLGEIVQVEQEALAYWVRDGLLPSHETEARKHKRFDAWAVRLAIILREMRQYGMSIVAMRELVAKLEAAVEIYGTAGDAPYIADAVDRLAENAGDTQKTFECMKRIEGASDVQLRAAIEAAARVPEGRQADWWLGYALTVGDDILVIFRDENGQLATQLGITYMLPASSAIALDLRRLFAIDWLSQ